MSAKFPRGGAGSFLAGSLNVRAYPRLRVPFSSIYIYTAVECRGCSKYYIGETNNLRKRVTLHNQHIRHENLRMIPVSGHIASCSNTDPKYFTFPFFKMKTDSIIERKEKEKYFIQKFKPNLNST